MEPELRLQTLLRIQYKNKAEERDTHTVYLTYTAMVKYLRIVFRYWKYSCKIIQI